MKIYPYQKNNLGFQKEVKNYIDRHSKLVSNINFLNKLTSIVPLNHFFLIQFGKLTDTAFIDELHKHLSRYHKKEGIQTIDLEGLDFGRILNNYNMFTFGRKQRTIGGGLSKKERVCRFCMTKSGNINEHGDKVTFNGTSHAFSGALGNKSVICKDECDSCNNRFSKSIEPSIVNYFSVFRTLYGLDGKGGKKQVRGPKFAMDSQLLDMKIDSVLTDDTDCLRTRLYLNETFVPQNVYRSLSKFIISVMEKSDVVFFEKTITWINGEFDAKRLPPITMVQDSKFFKREPMLVHFQRKTNDRSLPFCVGEFHYADFVLIFILPFCSNDDCLFLSKHKYDSVIKLLTEPRPAYNWKMVSFNSKKKMKIAVDLNVEGLKIGENAFLSNTAS